MIRAISSAGPVPVQSSPTSSRPFTLEGRTARPLKAWSQQVEQIVGDLQQRRVQLDEVIANAQRGRSFTPSQLLALQAQIYRYSEDLELVSRVVDKSLSAVKTVINTQL